MSIDSLFSLLRGSFHFLRPDLDEIHRLLPGFEKTLPLPQRVFLEDESATPVHGFPILQSSGLRQLSAALERYVYTEEEAQLAIYRRQPHDRKSYQAAWERYRQLFVRALENVTLSSYGRQFPAVFWLHHSLELARLLKETPRRVLRQDSELGRRYGDHIKYRVLERYLERAVNTTYDLVTRLAVDTEEAEEELFPRLLTRMRDNVLIFTEDHISPDLAELTSYFNGYLGIDGRDLRQRLAALDAWHREMLAKDAELQRTVKQLLGIDPGSGPRELFKRPGYVTFLAGRRGLEPDRGPTGRQMAVWESLLIKLKEFELFHALRRLLLAVEMKEPPDGGPARLVGRSPGLGRAALGGRSEVSLSVATRPMDFMAPWVVDPLIHRFGLIYDITHFSEIVSVLRRSGSELQDRSFRRMFRFQRRINRLAAARRLQLEKYLGDGAFYSSRYAAPMLAGALRIQRSYRAELEEDFPFDRGLRIALNYGQYRLIPVGREPGGAQRYEFFGHSLVELSRLTTGKAAREIDEIKNLLVSYGYPEPTVHSFFLPLQQRNVDVVDKTQESRRFYAYINKNGNLINEGIVATETFIVQLAAELGSPPLARGTSGGSGYVALTLDDGGEELTVGLRKLGPAHLKGLDRLPVYEVVDGIELGELTALPGRDLAAALEQIFKQELSGRNLAEPSHELPVDIEHEIERGL